jgi:hypothetical protein
VEVKNKYEPLISKDLRRKLMLSSFEANTVITFFREKMKLH